jgi:hypothetical protein
MSIPDIVKSRAPGGHQELKRRFWREEALDCLARVGVKNAPDSLLEKVSVLLAAESLEEAREEIALMEALSA